MVTSRSRYRLLVVVVAPMIGLLWLPAAPVAAADAGPLPARQTATYATTDPQVSVPDGRPGQQGGGPGQPVSQTVVVEGAGPELLELQVDVDVWHERSSELTATIRSPGGVTATLFAQPRSWSSRDVGSVSLTLSDDGATTLDDRATDDPPPAGTYRASAAGGAAVSLDETFGGIDPDGTWTITMQDSEHYDTGYFKNSELTITSTDPACDTASVAFDRAKARMQRAKERVAEARAGGDRAAIERAVARKRDVRQERITAKAAFREECDAPTPG